jgi:hypothetical protein
MLLRGGRGKTHFPGKSSDNPPHGDMVGGGLIAVSENLRLQHLGRGLLTSAMRAEMPGYHPDLERIARDSG